MRVDSIATSVVLLMSLVCTNVFADSYEEGLVAYAQGDYHTAEQHFISAANGGDSGARHMLMRLYSEQKMEIGDPAINDQQAIYWTRQAARSGFVTAQYALAEHYSRPAATREDLEQAFHWYGKAADQGHHGAMEKLGDLYQQGDVVDKNSRRARQLYIVAASEYNVFAQKGDPVAQNALAGMYENAKGVRFDIQAAVNWYKKAALQDYALAQYNLGRLFAQGRHVDKNIAEARYWLEKAAGQGLKQARLMLTRLEQGLDTSVAMK